MRRNQISLRRVDALDDVDLPTKWPILAIVGVVESPDWGTVSLSPWSVKDLVLTSGPSTTGRGGHMGEVGYE